MRVLSFCFLIFFKTNLICQELLLVIDEQFANKTFTGFDDLQGQILGDLNWQIAIGGNPYMNVDIGDGLGQRNLHYYINPDELWTFTRPENGYTTSDGLVLEAKGYPDLNNLSPTLNDQIGTGITYFYPWSFRRGYFEIKAKLPVGDGIQSAFHLFGDLAQIPGFNCDDIPGDQDKNWQEIDIWETGGSGINTLRNNIHWSKALVTPPPFENFHSCDVFCDHCQFAYRGVNCETEYNFTDSFHTIGLYWDEQYVIFILNGDIYRYWIKVPDVTGGPNNCNDHPDPIQFGEPRKILFTDAMILNLGIGYGIADGYQENAQPGNLNGPNPDEELPSSSLEVEYFRYWVFLPCEDQPDESVVMVNSNDGQLALYNNIKSINSYNEYQYGHYEAGKEVICENSFIGPSTTDGIYEPPYWYSDQLNLIASRSIHLKNGFHAKGAEFNLPIDAQFHAEIKTCSDLSIDQQMPLINNINHYEGFTFVEDFMFNIGEMIFESYKTSGPLKSQISSDEELRDISSVNEQSYKIHIDQENWIVYKIYPNPANSVIQVRFENVKTNSEIHIQLFDLFGQQLFSETFLVANQEIDISDFSSGVYLLKITFDDCTLTHEIIKS